jgi:pyruvate kinase
LLADGPRSSRIRRDWSDGGARSPFGRPSWPFDRYLVPKGRGYDTRMKIKVICTLGPASLDGDVIRRLDEQGVDLFRINLSHTPLEQVEPTIDFVRRHSAVPISLDTEGAQVRCGVVASELLLERGKKMILMADEVRGSGESLTLRPRSTFEALQVGSLVSIDFHGAALRVTGVGDTSATAVVEQGGRIGSNKAVAVEPAPVLPALTAKDQGAIEIGARKAIRHYCLSFASSGDDVATLRRLIPEGSSIIAKIESRLGVRNMDGIIASADAIIIDRGDLSREVPLQHVPYYQKAIVRRANRWNTPLYVATNLLESMVTNRRPTIAEANDIANTLLDGVHGLVLAAETAIGIDPVGAAAMISTAIEAFDRANIGALLEEDRPAASAPPLLPIQ